MKKRCIVKKWVKNLLITIEVVLFMLLSVDFNNFLLFITSKIIIIITMYLIGKILIKHTNILR